MANDVFSSDNKDFNELLKNYSDKGQEVEQVINDYIHNEAPGKISPSITEFLPVGKWNKNHVHAKSSNAFTRQENFNLAVKVFTAKEFNYLVFPDEGLGTSKGKMPQDFTGRGLEAVTGTLIDELIENITKKFN